MRQMEKSRAIELLEHLAWDKDNEGNCYGDALNMAIDALKAQLSSEGTTSDTISRQAAIDAINHICPVDTEYDCTLLDRVDVRCVLSDLPSAQPESGRWIYTSGMNEQCSACGQYFPLSYFKDRPFDIKYCPHCGAYMRGEKDERTD